MVADPEPETLFDMFQASTSRHEQQVSLSYFRSCRKVVSPLKVLFREKHFTSKMYTEIRSSTE